jgi:transposase
VLSLPPAVRIWLSAQPADLRKSFDGLAALVEQWLGADPLSGHVFVFRNKAADRVKLLVWDEDGYVIYYKRLEAGTFRFPIARDQASVAIRAADLLMLLDGVDLSSVRRRHRYRRRSTSTPALEVVGSGRSLT